MRWIIYDIATLTFDIIYLIVNIIQGSLWAILFGVCAVVVLASLIAQIGMCREISRALKTDKEAQDENH